jgi:hypothetical protein
MKVENRVYQPPHTGNRVPHGAVRSKLVSGWPWLIGRIRRQSIALEKREWLGFGAWD